MTIQKWKKDFPFLLEQSAVEHVIEKVGKKQEILYRMSDKSTHYDVHGNEMVYKYLEPHLKKFLSGNNDSNAYRFRIKDGANGVQFYGDIDLTSQATDIDLKDNINAKLSN